MSQDVDNISRRILIFKVIYTARNYNGVITPQIVSEVNLKKLHSWHLRDLDLGTLTVGLDKLCRVKTRDYRITQQQ